MAKPAPKKKGKPGRPPHEPTDKDKLLVQSLKVCGYTDESIAAALGISADTLVKKYGDKLANGKARLDGEVVGHLIDKIRKGDTASILFYLKTRCGWSETNIVKTVKAHEDALDELE